MDQFIKNVYFILDIIKRPVSRKQIVEHKIIEKQYLTYYLYRILCKYEGMMKYVVSMKKIRDIYNILRIPPNNKNKCYPLAHKLTYNEKLLDLVILGILDIFKEVDDTLSTSISNQQYKNLNEFLAEKTLEEILLDIKVLQRLFPNLGVTGVKPYLYEFINISENKVSNNNKFNFKGQKSQNNKQNTKQNNKQNNVSNNLSNNLSNLNSLENNLDSNVNSNVNSKK